MKAKALVEVREPWGPENPHMHYATIRCSECDFVQWSSVNTVRVTAEEYATNSIMRHLETHEPGRAPDIDVEYVLSASCSVCEDGIGNVETLDGESIGCADCGTTWSEDGTYGELKEVEDDD